MNWLCPDLANGSEWLDKSKPTLGGEATLLSIWSPFS